MNKTKALTIGFVLMTILNIGIIISLFVSPNIRSKPPRQDHNPLADEITALLQLDSDQQTVFMEMIAKHKREISEIEKRQKVLLLQYFNYLQSEKQSAPAELMEEFLTQEQNKIQITYTHFEEVKHILTEDQKPYFELFIKKVIPILGIANKKNPPPPRD